jgi:hypothetical protein
MREPTLRRWRTASPLMACLVCRLVLPASSLYGAAETGSSGQPASALTRKAHKSHQILGRKRDVLGGNQRVFERETHVGCCAGLFACFGASERVEGIPAEEAGKASFRMAAGGAAAAWLAVMMIQQNPSLERGRVTHTSHFMLATSSPAPAAPLSDQVSPAAAGRSLCENALRARQVLLHGLDTGILEPSIGLIPTWATLTATIWAASLVQGLAKALGLLAHLCACGEQWRGVLSAATCDRMVLNEKVDTRERRH